MIKKALLASGVKNNSAVIDWNNLPLVFLNLFVKIMQRLFSSKAEGQTHRAALVALPFNDVFLVSFEEIADCNRLFDVVLDPVELDFAALAVPSLSINNK